MPRQRARTLQKVPKRHPKPNKARGRGEKQRARYQQVPRVSSDGPGALARGHHGAGNYAAGCRRHFYEGACRCVSHAQRPPPKRSQNPHRRRPKANARILTNRFPCKAWGHRFAPHAVPIRWRPSIARWIAVTRGLCAAQLFFASATILCALAARWRPNEHQNGQKRVLLRATSTTTHVFRPRGGRTLRDYYCFTLLCQKKGRHIPLAWLPLTTGAAPPLFSCSPRQPPRASDCRRGVFFTANAADSILALLLAASLCAFWAAAGPHRATLSGK